MKGITMTEAKNRIFVKKGLNGERLTRTVTDAASEVAATFDGYKEEKSAKPSAAANSNTSGSAGSSTKQSS
jgi:hypothetical protein